MVIRIIDETPHESVVKKAVCRNCGVTLEYVPNDIKSRDTMDYGGTTDTLYFIDCLKCQKQVQVKRY